ncbi:MAG TPA: ATP-binding protein, partial [Burkholderiaceae bacterium]|nr:ATP-binding protein [Burkholderiaceae bacterium]
VVITNLVDNAWKYTAKTAEPRIRFWAERTDDGQTWYCLADNGAGFNPAHASQLFQPFKRLHRQDEFVGIGIGLATVQRIVQRHGGEIRADGEPGRGVTFRFTLQAVASDSPPETGSADQSLPDAHDAARPSKNAFSR